MVTQNRILSHGPSDELLAQYENKLLQMLAQAENQKKGVLSEKDRDELTRIKIPKIKEALEKIEESTYGTCTKCQNDIDQDTLKSNPLEMLCTQCARTKPRLAVFSTTPSR